jgi:hypothetical protein
MEVCDVDGLSCFARVLMNNPMALDITALHLRLDELINRTVTGPQFDLTTVGDPQTTVSHIGNIIMFIQVVILRFKVHVMLGDQCILIVSLDIRPCDQAAHACLRSYGWRTASTCRRALYRRDANLPSLVCCLV